MIKNQKIKINNALIVPAIKDYKGNGKFIHGINHDGDNSFLDFERNEKKIIDYESRKEFIKNSKIKKLNGTYVYGGILPSHFGHLLSEGIHRLYSAHHHKHKIILLPDTEDYNLDTFHKILKLWKIPKEKITLITNLVEIEELIVPEIYSTLGGKINENYIDEIEKFIDLDLISKKNTPEKIIVSRRNFLNQGRVCGMNAIIDILVNEQGFYELQPEKFDLYKQLSMIIGAKEIIWEEGSAIHLLELLPKLSSKMILIKRRNNYSAFDKLINSRAKTFFIHENTIMMNTGKAIHNSPSRFNKIYDLVDFLNESIGFLLNQRQIEEIKREEIFDAMHHYRHKGI